MNKNEYYGIGITELINKYIQNYPELFPDVITNAWELSIDYPINEIKEGIDALRR